MHAGSVFRRVTIILSAVGLITAGIQAKSEARAEKTKTEIDTHIKQVGGTAPDWWNSVEMSYPETLDLNWPVQGGFMEGRSEFGERRGRGFRGERGGHGFPGGRGGRGFGREQNLQTMVDQYLIQVVYPNASRHKEGIKLVNHLMILHKDDKEKLKRSLNTLGQMFYELFDDYTRAAFWWQKYSQMGGSTDSLKMARCYFELGSKATAAELLLQADSSYSRNNKDLIKLWAKIGEVDKALEMIESNSDTNSSGMDRIDFRGGRGSSQSENYLLAAEICRGAGRYDEAIGYYEKVLALPDSYTRSMNRHGTDGKVKAQANLEATRLLKKLDLKRVPDGSYTASTAGYGGPLTIRVVINGGNIESVKITQHWETFSYLVMAEPTARQIVTKQGFEGVDVITGATVTSDAIINAAAKALVNAME
jgi:uncharacterized protein with FMN-binding domain